MAMRIRLFKRKGRKLSPAKAMGWGSFSGIPPMVLGGLPCRALEAEAVLSSGADGLQRSPGFLFAAAGSDPNQLLFMDCSGGAPFGSVEGSVPECADWIYDEDRRAWSGLARGEGGVPFEAPLFAFWLLQAAVCAAAGRHGYPEEPSWSDEGKKRPQKAAVNLDWAWQVADENRLEMFHAAVSVARAQFGSEQERTIGELTHPEMAQAFRKIQPSAYVTLAGSDAALLAIIESCELAKTSSPPPARGGGFSKRL